MANEQIIDVLVKNGVDVVAITDHHKIDVRRIRELQKLGGERITVLPGIELRDEHGSKPIHYICIFPEDCDLNHVWTIIKGSFKLTSQGIKEQGGDDEVYVGIKRGAEIARELGGVVSIHAGEKMRLTPYEFGKQIPMWYRIWEEANPTYFPLEERLTQKACLLGYLEKADLVAITKVLGNPYNIRGKIQRANTNDEVKEKTKEAIQQLDNPASALRSMMSLKQWRRTYASKTLRCIYPQKYGALDSKLIRGINPSYLPSINNETKRYEEFLNFCRQVREKVPEPGPRKGEWFLADIEIALFQFIWNSGEIV